MRRVYIRPAKIDDLEEIKRLENLSFQYSYTREFLLYLLKYCELFFVAELETKGNIKIVGYVCGKIERACRGIVGHVFSIAVDPKYRRRGIGKMLMEKIIDGFKKLCVTYVYLECRISNVAAQRFYESLGFLRVGIVRKYYQNGEDAVIYKKDLLCE